MDLISELQRDRRLWGTCPECEEEFRITNALLFVANRKWPELALQRLAEARQDNKAAREELKKLRTRMTSRAAVTAESVNLGKIVEKIVPSFDGFSFQLRDCRALFEPIDYLVFSGLSRTGMVESLTLMDVKSGRSRLNTNQKNIAAVVNEGRVGFKIIEGGKGE